jgi:hypothetical protein
MRREDMESDKYDWSVIYEEAYTEPEKILWAAVLKKAWNDVIEAGTSQRAKYYLYWFTDNSYYIGSLRFICDHLNLDYNYIKEKAIKVFQEKGGKL